MKAYTTPQLVEYGTAGSLTADSRENSSDDTFFDINGERAGGPRRLVRHLRHGRRHQLPVDVSPSVVASVHATSR